MQSRVHCVIRSPSIARRLLPTSNHHPYASRVYNHHYHHYRNTNREFTTTPRMSDSNYLSFLEKASADHSAGQTQTQTQTQSQSQSQSVTRTLDTDAQVPASLRSIDAFYTSDTDEPFEPVVLRWEGGGVLPDSGIFPCHWSGPVN